MTVAGCGAAESTVPVSRTGSGSGSSWGVPEGWRHETLPFPLEFAPALAHRGVEELRFAPGMFDASAPGYFTYAFAWRLEDGAELTAAQLSDELTAYFRGLMVAVDEDKHRIVDPGVIEFAASAHGDGFVVGGDILDAFTNGQLVKMSGMAHRQACAGGGALWTFSVGPDGGAMLGDAEQIARAASCDQQPLANARER